MIFFCIFNHQLLFPFFYQYISIQFEGFFVVFSPLVSLVPKVSVYNPSLYRVFHLTGDSRGPPHHRRGWRWAATCATRFSAGPSVILCGWEMRKVGLAPSYGGWAGPAKHHTAPSNWQTRRRSATRSWFPHFPRIPEIFLIVYFC